MTWRQRGAHEAGAHWQVSMRAAAHSRAQPASAAAHLVHAGGKVGEEQVLVPQPHAQQLVQEAAGGEAKRGGRAGWSGVELGQRWVRAGRRAGTSTSAPLACPSSPPTRPRCSSNSGNARPAAPADLHLFVRHARQAGVVGLEEAHRQQARAHVLRAGRGGAGELAAIGVVPWARPCKCAPCLHGRALRCVCPLRHAPSHTHPLNPASPAAPA